ncbi:DsbA family protein [Microbacteriaceae bacterium 4G12]
MKKNKFTILIIFFSLAFLVLAGTIVYTIINTRTASKEDVFNYSSQQTLGDKKATIHVVEFGDFKCPACRNWDATVLPQLKKDYIDTGKVQFHFINFPFVGKDSDLAAAAGEAIYKQDHESFWTYYNELYQLQQNEKKEWITEALLVDLVKQKLPKINVEQFQKDMKSKAILDAVDKDNSIALKLKVQGAPTFYVNGELANSDYASLKKAIEKAQKK